MDDRTLDLAPVSEAALREVEEQARATLRTHLSARKLVDVSGPHGWDHAAANPGRVEFVDEEPAEGVRAGVRRTQPLVELRADFELSRHELARVDRGADDPELEPVVAAARSLAWSEDRLVYYGFGPADVEGLCPSCDHTSVASEDWEDYPRLVSEGINVLRQEGVGGPYALALSPAAFTGVAETAGGGGYPVLQHVEQILDGPIVWAPALAGGMILSLRGGDFELVLGRDVSLGYDSHDADDVGLYLEESVTFRLPGPEAAVVLEPVD
ncbi:MAG: family 1 encapsulin nanocompartment shell protein [Gemmatimonadota bacterium]